MLFYYGLLARVCKPCSIFSLSCVVLIRPAGYGALIPPRTPPSNVPSHKVKTVWGRGEPVLVACTKVVAAERRRRRRRAGERSHGSTRPARLKIRPSDNGTMHASILAFISPHTQPPPHPTKQSFLIL